MLRRYSDISKWYSLSCNSHRLFFSTVLILLLFSAPGAWSQGYSGSKDTPVDTRGWLDVQEEMRNERYPKYDPAFEEGKKIFQGDGRHKKYAYCLPSNASEAAKPSTELSDKDAMVQSALEKGYIELNRKNLSPYRSLAVGDFANLLYDCDDPGKKVLAKLEKEDAGLVIYYLNREYRLRLRQPEGPGKQAKRFQ